MSLVAFSSSSTFLLTRKGEVLVCPNVHQIKHRDFNEHECGKLDFSSESFLDALWTTNSHYAVMGGKPCWGTSEGNNTLEFSTPNNVEEEARVDDARMNRELGSKEGSVQGEAAGSQCHQQSKRGDKVSIPFQGNFDLVESPVIERGDPCNKEQLSTPSKQTDDVSSCFGNKSPTPVLSFDYHGYEPPTLELYQPHDGSVSKPQGSLLLYNRPCVMSNSTSCAVLERESGNGTAAPCQSTPKVFGTCYSLPTVNEQTSAFRGVPTFFHPLSQIRVTRISAHPQGHHVLLISHEGLLFSFGSNACGQLGLGERMSTTSTVLGGQLHCPSIAMPSIVTPLLENGGKTINCAAGIDYSLVVVKTEGARSTHHKRKQHGLRPSLRSCNDELGSGAFDWHTHHQVYGFGNNNFRKLGLLKPSVHMDWPTSHSEDEMCDCVSGLSSEGQCFTMRPPSSCLLPHNLSVNDSQAGGQPDSKHVFLPRRVALHCKVFPPTLRAEILSSQGVPPFGIFSIAASICHSAALARCPSGAIELYTWGRGGEVALGLSISHDSCQSCQQGILSLHPERNSTISLMSMNSRPPSQALQPERIFLNPSLLSPLSSVSPFLCSASTEDLPSSLHSEHLEFWVDSEMTIAAIFPEKLCGNALSLPSHPDNFLNVMLGVSCTYLLSSRGHWMSFGSHSDGLTDLGRSAHVEMINDLSPLVPTSLKAAYLNADRKHLLVDAVLFEQNVSVREYAAAAMNSSIFPGNRLNCTRLVSGYDQVFLGNIGFELYVKLVLHIHSQIYPFSTRNLSRLGFFEKTIPMPVQGFALSSVQDDSLVKQFCHTDTSSPWFFYGGANLWCDEYKDCLQSTPILP